MLGTAPVWSISLQEEILQTLVGMLVMDGTMGEIPFTAGPINSGFSPTDSLQVS